MIFVPFGEFLESWVQVVTPFLFPCKDSSPPFDVPRNFVPIPLKSASDGAPVRLTTRLPRKRFLLRPHMNLPPLMLIRSELSSNERLCWQRRVPEISNDLVAAAPLRITDIPLPIVTSSLLPGILLVLQIQSSREENGTLCYLLPNGIY